MNHTEKHIPSTCSHRLLGLLLLLAFAATALTACGTGSATDDDLTAAETALSEGGTAHAREICDALLAGSAASELTDAQLGRAAIIYMKLSEQTDDDDHAATATECFRRALTVSADSLQGFFVSLPRDDQRHFALLRRLSLSIDNPVDLDAPDIEADGDFEMETNEASGDTNLPCHEP